jgi:hypothetical protein
MDAGTPVNYTGQIISYLPLIAMALTAGLGSRLLFIPAPYPLKFFARVWLVLLCAEVTGHLIGLYYSNQWFYNILQAAWVMALSHLYFLVLVNRGLKSVIQIFIALFGVFVVMNSLFIQGFTSLQTITYVAGGLFVIFLAGAYFRQLFGSTDNEKITRDPFFWLSFGLIVYFGGTVPFFGMWNYLLQYFLEFTEFYFSYIYKSFSLFLTILVAIAFVCRKDYPK